MRDFNSDAKIASSAVADVESRLAQRDPAWWHTGLADAARVRDTLDSLLEKHGVASGPNKWEAIDSKSRLRLSNAVNALKTKLYSRQLDDDIRMCRGLIENVERLQGQKDAAWWRPGLDALQRARDAIATLEEEKYGDFAAWLTAIAPLRARLTVAKTALRSKLGARQLSAAAWECGKAIDDLENALAATSNAALHLAAVAGDRMAEFEAEFSEVDGFETTAKPLTRRMAKAQAHVDSLKSSANVGPGTIDAADGGSPGVRAKSALPAFEPFLPFASAGSKTVKPLETTAAAEADRNEALPALPAIPALPTTNSVIAEAAEKAAGMLASRASQLPWGPVELAVDWSFADADSFTSLPEEEQLERVKSLTTTLCRKLILGSTAVAGAVGDNDTIKAIVQPLVRRVLLTYDADDRIVGEDSAGDRVGKAGGSKGSFFSFNLSADGCLTVAVNLSAHDQSPQGSEAKERFGELLQLPTRLLMADAEKAARTAEFMLAQKLGVGAKDPSRIRVHVDTDGLVAQPGWQRLSPADQAKFVKSELCKKLVKEHIASADGIGGLVANHEVVAAAFKALVGTISVEVDCANGSLFDREGNDGFCLTIAHAVFVFVGLFCQLIPWFSFLLAGIHSRVGSGSYSEGWEILFDSESSTLRMRYNLSDMRAFSSFGDKVDHALDLVARRVDFSAAKKLASYAKRLNAKAGLQTDVVVDWMKFTESPG